jgi:hypothetical protein
MVRAGKTRRMPRRFYSPQETLGLARRINISGALYENGGHFVIKFPQTAFLYSQACEAAWTRDVNHANFPIC